MNDSLQTREEIALALMIAACRSGSLVIYNAYLVEEALKKADELIAQRKENNT